MTTKSDTPDRNPDHDEHAVAIYRPMALRFHARYLDMRWSADFRGGDLEGHEPLSTELDTQENYKDAVEECLWEDPDSADAVLALVEFAGGLSVRCCATDSALTKEMLSTRLLGSPPWADGSTSTRCGNGWERGAPPMARPSRRRCGMSALDPFVKKSVLYQRTSWRDDCRRDTC
jgi:hypothetical protein